MKYREREKRERERRQQTKQRRGHLVLTERKKQADDVRINCRQTKKRLKSMCFLFLGIMQLFGGLVFASPFFSFSSLRFHAGAPVILGWVRKVTWLDAERGSVSFNMFLLHSLSGGKINNE